MRKPTDLHRELQALKREAEDQVHNLERRLDRVERRHAEYSLAMSFVVRSLVDLLARDRGQKAGELAAILEAASAEWKQARPIEEVPSILRAGLNGIDMVQLLEFLRHMPEAHPSS